MKTKNHLIFIMLTTLVSAPSAFAESKRVEVYALSQTYWDTQPGETLGEIVTQLLPNNPNMHKKLIADIVNLNSDAFQDGNPDFMQANTRLWLPNNIPQADGKIENGNTQVETFSWGNIKRPQR